MSDDIKDLQKSYNKQGGQLDEHQRLLAKTRFLDAMMRTNIRTAASESAGISMNTVRSWISEGFISQEELDFAYESYQDAIRSELTRRTFVGDEQPLVYNGRIVIDDEGRPQTIRKKDNRMLIELAKRHLPEFMQPERIEVTQHTVVDGIPEQYRIVIDSRELLAEELTTIMQIATAIEIRGSRQLVEGSIS